MDKLDQNIEEAKETHEPSPTFVPSTMNKVEAVGTPKKRLGWKLWAPVGGVVAVAAVVAIILIPHLGSTTANTTTGSTTPSSTTTSPQAPTATPIDPTNTSDSALNSDLNSINASLSQSSNDQSAVDSSVNDNQQQITVPTE